MRTIENSANNNNTTGPSGIDYAGLDLAMSEAGRDVRNVDEYSDEFAWSSDDFEDDQSGPDPLSFLPHDQVWNNHTGVKIGTWHCSGRYTYRDL